MVHPTDELVTDSPSSADTRILVRTESESVTPPASFADRLWALLAATLVGTSLVEAIHNLGPRAAKLRGEIGGEIFGFSPSAVAAYLVTLEGIGAAAFIGTVSAMSRFVTDSSSPLRILWSTSIMRL